MLLKDLESDWNFLTFGPPPGVLLPPEGTPKGAEGEIFYFKSDSVEIRTIGVFLNIIEEF